LENTKKVGHMHDLWQIYWNN